MSEIDHGDEEDTLTEEERIYLASLAEIEDWKYVLRSKQGRNVVWSILEEAGFHRLSWAGEDFPRTMLINEGRRTLANWVFNKLFTADPNSYTIMRLENDNPKTGKKET